MARSRIPLALFAASLVGAAMACVDLFHSTDFPTLCSTDASACADPDASDAGDTTVDAKKPIIDFCKLSASEARNKAMRACAWLGACSGGLGDTAFGPCMIRALAMYDCTTNPGLRPRGVTEEIWSCLSSVASCGDVDACIFPERTPECAGVTGGTFTACAGEGANAVRLECGRPERGRAVGVEPCALFGKKCVRIDESRAVCVGVGGVNCNVASPRCEGTGAVQCDVDDPPRDRGVDCVAFGAGACSEDLEAGAVACVPTGTTACEGTTKATCDDAGRATACAASKSIVIDCTRLDLQCDESRAGRGYDPLSACGEPDGGCTSADQCDGDTLKSCANGHSFEVTCKSVGLGACTKAAGRSLVSCGPP